MKITINQIHTDSLSCEPILRRTENGELLCVCQCKGPGEPHPENRVYVFHSLDDGKTWSNGESIYPEDGQAVYCTEVSVMKNEITAYLTVHSGYFLDWKCYMMKSFDNGYTWKNCGTPPFFPEYTFIRGTIILKNGNILIPYQNYPITRKEHDRVLNEEKCKCVWSAKGEYCESGVLISEDNGETYTKHIASRMSMKESWIWSEPTIVELADGTISMLMRKCRSGWLWRCDSIDGGRTWGETNKTDIPNPSNKPKLINLENGNVALIHTPNGGSWATRFPLEMWIGEDLVNWERKIRLTDFPGGYSYSDGFYEDGHVKFTIEHNRHSILYFDVEL